MTRVLSALLEAREPTFQQSLRQLEILAGHPQTDIRLSTEITQKVRDLLHELNLDSNDTSGKELYGALGERLKADEVRFISALSANTLEGSDVVGAVAHALNQHISAKSCFALKSSVAKKLLKANLPKKTMKQLGYRSADSMLKHESAASLYAAAWLIESSAWSKKMIGAYSKLHSADFEQRSLLIEHPSSKRWHTLSESIVASKRQSVFSFKELGSVVLLPLPSQYPTLSVLTTAVLAINAINEIRAAGTYLKLHQLQPAYGSIVQQVVTSELFLPTSALDQPVPWQGLHQYFERFRQVVRSDLFEPVVAAEELAWTSVEKVLANIEPSLSTWEHSSFIGLLQGDQAVSCNLSDTLLSHINKLPYERRVSHHFRQALQSEILLRYLSHDKLEQTVFASLQSRFQLAPEMVPIDNN